MPEITQRSRYQHSPLFCKPDCVNVGVKLSREIHLRLHLRLGYSHDLKVEGSSAASRAPNGRSCYAIAMRKQQLHMNKASHLVFSETAIASPRFSFCSPCPSIVEAWYVCIPIVSCMHIMLTVQASCCIVHAQNCIKMSWDKKSNVSANSTTESIVHNTV